MPTPTHTGIRIFSDSEDLNTLHAAELPHPFVKSFSEPADFYAIFRCGSGVAIPTDASNPMRCSGTGIFDKKAAVVAMTLDKPLERSPVFSCGFGCECDISFALKKHVF